jgi:hypothetical protein
LRLYPAASGPIDAFIRLCDAPKWVLRSSTTRTYKARMIKCIEIEVAAGHYDPEHAIEGVTKIDELLEQRRGHPEARTSRLKYMEVTKEEVQLIADDLQKRIAANKTDMVDIALCLFVQLAPRFGLRPCECARDASLDERWSYSMPSSRTTGRLGLPDAFPGACIGANDSWH